ncbi:hypothetical protein C2845_PM11G21550 [Panicum miliaceum]|uniref:F-box domain-containing protein n=1 Tax=Panicum miliaceum TaxID=4540 RepID=A0A3L6RVW2_PANMI|nr:hypothetical protein C2845_PM11G21550 [Panicum miliaceum]
MEKKSGGLLSVQRKRGSQLQLLDLPTNVICSIISRLPLRDAIRTSILSSQWRYVWCDHANLTFNRYALKRESAGSVTISEHEFLAMVDGVLRQHSGTGVDLMEVRCALHNKHADRIDRWVKFAVVSRTKELILHLSNACRTSLSRNMPYELPAGRPEPYSFACHLFGASSDGSYLQRLQLTSVSLKLPDNFNGFPNLKKLSMIIEMKCGLATLEYSGPVVPLQFLTTSSLRNVCINLTSDGTTALDYITTGFPSALQHLQTLNLRCDEHKRAISPVRPIKFIYLRHLSKIDVLDYAYLLDCAPFLEKLEIHMWMQCHHESYRAEHGELRSLPWHQHTHLKSVCITGFFGRKDQVELALHILRSSSVLKAMKLDSRVKIIPGGPYAAPEIYKRRHYLNGYLVATAFVQGADRNNVVQVSGVRKVGFDGVTEGHARFYFISEPEL